MIKKIILFLLIFCHNTIHCQSTNDSQSEKKFIIPNAPYFSIFNIFGASTVLPNSGSPDYTTSNAWIILAGYIPVNHDKLYIYTQFRTSFYMGESSYPLSTIQPIMHLENTKIGFLFGLGGIVKDWRQNDIGWHIRLNGGFVFEGGVANAFIEIDEDRFRVLYDRFFNLGAEVDTIFYYNVKKHIAVNLGIHIGYQFSPYSGDVFYIEGVNQRSYVYFHYMTYGISAGISF